MRRALKCEAVCLSTVSLEESEEQGFRRGMQLLTSQLPARVKRLLIGGAELRIYECECVQLTGSDSFLLEVSESSMCDVVSCSVGGISWVL